MVKKIMRFYGSSLGTSFVMEMDAKKAVQSLIETFLTEKL